MILKYDINKVQRWKFTFPLYFSCSKHKGTVDHHVWYILYLTTYDSLCITYHLSVVTEVFILLDTLHLAVGNFAYNN